MRFRAKQIEATSAADGRGAEGEYHSPRKRAVLFAVGRRLVPHLIEATLIPTVLFYVTFMTMGPTEAFVVALGWSYIAVGRRLLARKPIPAIVLLAGIGITVRTLFAQVGIAATVAAAPCSTAHGNAARRCCALTQRSRTQLSSQRGPPSRTPTSGRTLRSRSWSQP